MAKRGEVVKKVRLEKLHSLIKKGINPYPAYYERTHTASQAKSAEGETVTVSGRLLSLRQHGGSTFADIHDKSGKIQVYFQKDKLGKTSYETIELLDVGDFVGVSGEVFTTQKGEKTIRADSWQILTKTLRSLPDAWYGLKDTEERYRKRYVDLLLNPEVSERLIIRSQVVSLLRSHLEENRFIEIETPILQPIYGGAAARPFVTHHNALDCDFYLRISDELYLKRLIVGGFEKVYEVGRDFRNEGIERSRNPEFTQLEFYWAYTDYNQLMDFTEELISSIVRTIKGAYEFSYQGVKLDFKPPWKRVCYRDLILESTGIDINQTKNEEDLLAQITTKKIKLDVAGIAGFGAVLDTLYKKVVRPKVVGPIFLMDRPVEMVPLAKAKEGDASYAATFQLVAVGHEFINAYNELNDPQEQRKRWDEETRLGKHGFEEHQPLDEDFIQALEYGMPPTAGWGLGVDRFVMLLTDALSIKEVIAFPTLRPIKH